MKRRRLRKIVATLIFTTLIWVFADLALDEELTVSNLKLSVAKSVNPTLWVTFSGQSSVPLEKIVLKGSARKVAEARQHINAGRFAREIPRANPCGGASAMRESPVGWTDGSIVCPRGIRHNRWAGNKPV